MEESSNDKINETFRNSLFSNISEAKKDILDTSKWLENPFSLAANIVPLGSLSTKESILNNFITDITTPVLNSGLESATLTENPFAVSKTNNAILGFGLSKALIDSTEPYAIHPPSTLVDVIPTGLGAISEIKSGLASSVIKNPFAVSKTNNAILGFGLSQSLIDPTQESAIYPPSTSLDIISQISLEPTSQNKIHEEQSDFEKGLQLFEKQDKKIEKLERNQTKVKNQIKKILKKFDDFRNDVHGSEEHMAKQIRILASNVEVLTALVEDDEDE